MLCDFSRLMRHGAAIAAVSVAIIVLPAWTAAARGPENIADVAEQVIDAVVNISTSQRVDAKAWQHARSAARLADGGVLRGVL